MVRRTMLDSRRNVALACALSALPGYVDAIGFLHLGGLFVAFMSGNKMRMGKVTFRLINIHDEQRFGLIPRPMFSSICLANSAAP
jgi:uncharacterized membrane protein YoaK (UPF0700 family)